MMSNDRGLDTSPPATSQAPLEWIRQRTNQCHSELEACLDWSLAFSSPDRYEQLLQRFLRVVEPLDKCIAEHLNTVPEGYDSRLRTSGLRRDIDVVQSLAYASGYDERVDTSLAYASGYDERVDTSLAYASGYDERVEPDLSYIASSAAAIGSLYVIEGSALGGQFLAKQVRSRLQQWHAGSLQPSQQSSPESEANELPQVDAYFVGRGSGTMPYWRGFCKWLNSELIDNHQAQAAAEAAIVTFHRFRDSLS